MSNLDTEKFDPFKKPIDTIDRKDFNQIINLYSKFKSAKEKEEIGIEDKYLFGLAEALVITIDKYKPINQEIIKYLAQERYLNSLLNLIAESIYFSEDYKYSPFNPDKEVLSEENR